MLSASTSGVVDMQMIHSYVQRCYRKEESSEEDAIEEDGNERGFRKPVREFYDPIDDTTPRKRGEEEIIGDDELLRLVEEDERQQLDMLDFITQNENGDGFFDLKEKASQQTANENTKTHEHEREVRRATIRMRHRRRDSSL